VTGQTTVVSRVQDLTDYISAEWARLTDTSIDIDRFGTRIDQCAEYLANCGNEGTGEFSRLLNEETGLPPMHIAYALLRGKFGTFW
jgi:hypothetical protein